VFLKNGDFSCKVIDAVNSFNVSLAGNGGVFTYYSTASCTGTKTLVNFTTGVCFNNPGASDIQYVVSKVGSNAIASSPTAILFSLTTLLALVLVF
jgi:hypothetical protein